MAGATTTINAASKALAVAFQDYVDGLAAGTVIKIVFVPGNLNGVALSGSSPNQDFPAGFLTTDTAEKCDRYYHVIGKANDAAANMIYSVNGMESMGRLPLFWKIAAANSESLADA